MPIKAESLTLKLKKALDQLPYVPWALALVWNTTRGLTLAWGGLLLLQGLLPVATVYLTRPLVDSLAKAVGRGIALENIKSTFVLLALMAAVLLLSDLLQSVNNWIRTAQAEQVSDHIRSLIHRKSVTVDLAFYESPQFYDNLHRARSEAASRPLSLMDNMGSLLQNGITLFAMAALLFQFGPWLPIALVASTIPAVAIVLRQNLRQHEHWLRTTADTRRAWYYDWVLTSKENAAELRVFGLEGHFQSAYQAVRKHLRRLSLKLVRDRALAELGARIAALLITGAVMALMVWRVLMGFATLGDLAFFYQAFNQGQQMMRSLLGNVSQIYTNCLFLDSLFEFLNLEPQLKDPAIPLDGPVIPRQAIHFHQVAFRYPATERFALRNFNLTIPAGRVMAIVGNNGAGKSTLVKLLCRLYDPESGSIQIDGVDLREVPIRELRNSITVLFQEPAHYHAPVHENIAFGDLQMMDSPQAIKNAADESGADSFIRRLPEGYATLLGRWFDGGTELSAGEWQRIALARAFLRQAPIIILDEPTSAMDSWAEADWLQRFRILAAGRTTILITHRFTTAMRADIIHVMQDGRIVESGNHGELLSQDGLYARSWKSQMQSWCDRI
jgi:ATP-binding cassette, subfamily B, bacterial